MRPHIKFRNRLEKAFYRVDRSNKLSEQGNKCYYCGCKLTQGTVTADHVIPLSTIGRIHRAENIVAACEACNTKKANKKIVEFEVDRFTILINESCQRIKERGWLADYNIRKSVGLNVRGSFKKWVKYKKKVGDYE